MNREEKRRAAQRAAELLKSGLRGKGATLGDVLNPELKQAPGLLCTFCPDLSDAQGQSLKARRTPDDKERVLLHHMGQLLQGAEASGIKLESLAASLEEGSVYRVGWSPALEGGRRQARGEWCCARCADGIGGEPTEPQVPPGGETH